MASRRQIMEAALVAERACLWTDLALAVSINDIGLVAERIVERIRMIGEVLGYATDPDDVLAPMDEWRMLVDDVPSLGLWPKRRAERAEGLVWPSAEADRYYRTGTGSSMGELDEGDP